MIVIPNVRTLYQIAGGETTSIKVIIAGGIPMPQVNLYIAAVQRPNYIKESFKGFVQSYPVLIPYEQRSL